MNLRGEQPEIIVIEHLRGLRRDIGDIRAEVQTLKAVMATKSDLQSLRADVACDTLAMQRDTGEQIVDLRLALIDYHSAAVGHGVNARSSSAGWNGP
jgi:hypothetical protein